ncbi:hypothetical protein SCLCIDRAFT_1216486 [Scleroderma citrinum Foug A]|uniref:Uncharacterized protein n=1 Tax=Scleroderma citrinum Foug A TaxID=1036808 RepID=A0A0C3DY06_9AGAM|nr:hypothetical protein SCLCIDRAFT_1216486 [Scleroderma citrinum Foug A]
MMVSSIRKMSKGVQRNEHEKKNRSNNYNPHTSSRRTPPYHPYMQAVSKRVYKLGNRKTGRLSPHARVKSDKGFIIPEAECGGSEDYRETRLEMESMVRAMCAREREARS